MKAPRLVVALIATVTLATAAACSSSGSQSQGSQEHAGGGGHDPVKLQLLAEVAGESPVAVNDYDDAYKMAIADINARGGLLGSKVTGLRTSAPLDNQGAVSAFLKAAQTDPTAIIGYPADTQVAAAASRIAQAKIPFLGLSDVVDSVTQNQKAGSPYLFQLRAADNAKTAAQDAQYLIQNLDKKRIGIMYADTPSNLADLAAASKEAKKLGATVVAERKHSLKTTDFTGDILAMKSAKADGIVLLTYPNQEAIVLKQMAQNGYNVPLTGTTSVETMIVNKIGTVAPGQHIYGDLDCNVQEKSPKWAARFEKKFHTPASDVSAGTYDAVMYVAKAIKKAKSTDPDKVRAAMASIKYTDGVCSGNMYSDARGVIQHGTVMVDYSVKPPKVVKRYP
jgi:branched-chain amino acid transport system substrate-binding protein